MSSAWQPSLGAWPGEGGVFFRVWAPDHQQVAVTFYEAGRPAGLHPLTRQAGGYWSGFVAGAGPGTLYMYRLDGQLDRPDPASRHQPGGVHGPSMVVDPSFAWSDEHWRGMRREDLILYELHTGTATPAGTFEALIEHLPGLLELGVTAIELMPVADFPGERNWGYDGVDLFAPARAYGGGRGLKQLVDAAHACGLGVLLDVVYNHLGPSGNYLGKYTHSYFSAAQRTPWGAALNFDGAECEAVRAFFIENALSWAIEYHLDGLRLDATQEIHDRSPEHVLGELARRVHAALPPDRHFVIFAEDPRNEALLVRPPEQGGCGLDGIWADDFSHVVRVALTGEQTGFLSAYRGQAGELAAILNGGWLYQGQPDPHSGTQRGTPAADLPPSSFVYAIQTHDHVGNRAFGERLNQDCSPAAYRAASALLLLAPGVPLLFMGQEWAASSPFLFFTDHEPALGRLVSAGRRKEYGLPDRELPDPQAPETFQRSKLRWAEQMAAAHAPVLRLYRDLIALRRQEPALRDLGRQHITASVAGKKAILLHLAGPKAGGRPLLAAVVLGGTGHFDLSGTWELILDSEFGAYGGHAEPAPPPGAFDLAGPRVLVWRGRAQAAAGGV